MRGVFPQFVARLILALIAGGSPRNVFAQSAPPEKVVGGPYVVNVGPRSATVMWVVQTGEASLAGC
jgi:hypothetical protein